MDALERLVIMEKSHFEMGLRRLSKRRCIQK